LLLFITIATITAADASVAADRVSVSRFRRLVLREHILKDTAALYVCNLTYGYIYIKTFLVLSHFPTDNTFENEIPSHIFHHSEAILEIKTIFIFSYLPER
jgi:hypothetical protein